MRECGAALSDRRSDWRVCVFEAGAEELLNFREEIRGKREQEGDGDDKQRCKCKCKWA